MTKLHEILAIEGDLDQTQKNIVEEATGTFKDKPEHFLEIVTKLEMINEADRIQDDTQIKAPVTTVADKLDYVAETVTRYLDVNYQKELANQKATGDIIVDDVVMVKAVPVTMLLGLESKLKTLREMYLKIPTLDPGRDWVPDTTRVGTFKMATPIKRMKTAKTVKSKVLYEATKEHPAQIDKWNEDVPVGVITETRSTGMLTPTAKSEMLYRLDHLIQAVKKARQRGNIQEVVKSKIGHTLFDYINHGKLVAQ